MSEYAEDACAHKEAKELQPNLASSQIRSETTRLLLHERPAKWRYGTYIDPHMDNNSDESQHEYLQLGDRPSFSQLEPAKEQLPQQKFHDPMEDSKNSEYHHEESMDAVQMLLPLQPSHLLAAACKQRSDISPDIDKSDLTGSHMNPHSANQSPNSSPRRTQSTLSSGYHSTRESFLYQSHESIVPEVLEQQCCKSSSPQTPDEGVHEDNLVSEQQCSPPETPDAGIHEDSLTNNAGT